MTAPNMISATSILGKTATVALSTTSPTEVLSNADASGKVLKVNLLSVSNVDGSVPANITIIYYSEDNIGGTGTEIIQLATVAVKEKLVVIDKNTFIYLEENRSIGATASAANDLKVIVSYEEIE
jgi:hypothetical protein